MRLCLKDIYRYIAIGQEEPILGISTWSADKKTIHVRFEGERRTRHYKTHDEDSRRRAIKFINKRAQEVH